MKGATLTLSLLFPLLLLLAPLGFSSGAFAAEVTMSPVGVQVRQVTPGFYSFEYCESGYCTPFGREAGYDEEALKNMRQSCALRGKLNPFASNVLKGVVLAAAASMTGPGALAFGLSGTGFVGAIFDQHNYMADAFAASEMKGMVMNQGSFEFSREDFNALYDGLKSCHQYYESTPAIWLSDCDRDFQCKRDLLKGTGLRMSDQEIEGRSALELFLIKMDLSRTATFGKWSFNQ